MTLLGWDSSDFDWPRGPMDLAAAAAAGVRFFTHKATEGTNVKHIYFGEAMRRARDAGIPFLGAYHVVRSPRNAQAEVDYFFSYINAQAPWLWSHPGFFVQVDLEKWPYDSVPAIEGEDFADLATAQTGKVAIIYASKGQYGNELAGTSHELWNANYPLNYTAGDFRDLYRRAGGDAGPGWSAYSGRTPVFWQYTSSAVIGRQPTCDANAYRGTLDQFRALITGGKPMTTPFVKDPDGVYLLWRAEAIAHLLDTFQGGPEKGKTVPLTATLKRIDANAAAAANAAPVAMSDTQYADLKASVLAQMPTAADVVDELTRRANAAKPQG